MALRKSKRLGIALLAVTLTSSGGVGAHETCLSIASWAVPADGTAKPVEAKAVLDAAARQSVVLLGESHDSAEHHRWQLATIAALHGLQPRMVLGFEMFPRRVQPALDRWVGGELTESEFLKSAEWRTVWSYDPALYMPIFHFARMHAVPMVALNVERELVRAVGKGGLESVPEAKREGVTRPAAPRAAYLDMLFESWVSHLPEEKKKANAGRDDPEFVRFVESQQVWDRVMAQRIAEVLAKRPDALVVGVMGSGHVIHGYGVPHQLRDLGVRDLTTLLPWDHEKDCKELAAGIADAVFAVHAPEAEKRPRPRLGVWLEKVADGVRILRVDKGSVAEAGGLREGDVVVEMAGRPVREIADIAEVVQRQAPGTWLPLRVKRGDASIEIVAKFPPVP